MWLVVTCVGWCLLCGGSVSRFGFYMLRLIGGLVAYLFAYCGVSVCMFDLVAWFLCFVVGIVVLVCLSVGVVITCLCGLVDCCLIDCAYMIVNSVVLLLYW